MQSAALHQFLREFLGFLGPDRLDLPARALDFLLLGVFFFSLLLDELLGTRELGTAGCLFLLLAHAQLREKLSSACDECAAEGQGTTFRVGSCDEFCKLRGLVRGAFLGGQHRR